MRSIVSPTIARPAVPPVLRPISPSPTTLRRAPALGRNDLQRRPRSMWRWDAFLPAAAGDAVSSGRGRHAAARSAQPRSRRRLDQGRVAQSDLVVQGPAGLGRAHHGQALRRQGHRLELVGQRRRRGGRLCRQGRTAVHRLHLRGLGRSAGPADARLWRHGGEGQRQGRSLAPAVAGRARVRLVSDLAVLRSRGRQQPLRHGRLQDDRLRDRRGVRLAAARLVRAAGLLRRCAVRHVEGLRGA